MAEMVIVQLPLFIVAMLAVLDVSYVAPGASLTWRSIALGVDLLAWLALVYVYDSGSVCATNQSAQSRGSAPVNVHVGYFFVPLLANLALVVSWITHRVKFAGLAPLNFTTNTDAFLVQRSIEQFSVVFFFFVAAFWFHEPRNTALRIRIMQRSKSASVSGGGGGGGTTLI